MGNQMNPAQCVLKMLLFQILLEWCRPRFAFRLSPRIPSCSCVLWSSPFWRVRIGDLHTVQLNPKLILALSCRRRVLGLGTAKTHSPKVVEEIS